ncbi:MAG: Rieske 2Fe-2S domain-containing protein [Actinomycetota bacterium]
MTERIDLGDLSELRDGQLRVYPDVGEHGVIVCRLAGQLHAIEDNCSHRDAKLSEGRLRGGLLTCPVHGAQFDPRTGEPQGPPAVTPVPCFAVHETEAGCSLELGD